MTTIPLQLRRFVAIAAMTSIAISVFIGFTSDKVLLMERKIFWMLFIVLGAAMDFTLPIRWSLALTLPLLFACWWVAYKSGWFG